MSMTGINTQDASLLGGIEHLQQSIVDILTTPLGTRVMRLDYGSRLMELIDSPVNPINIVAWYAAIAEALDKWEPRLKLERVRIVAVSAGRFEVSIEGVYVPTGTDITLESLTLEAVPV